MHLLTQKCLPSIPIGTVFRASISARSSIRRWLQAGSSLPDANGRSAGAGIGEAGSSGGGGSLHLGTLGGCECSIPVLLTIWFFALLSSTERSSFTRLSSENRCARTTIGQDL